MQRWFSILDSEHFRDRWGTFRMWAYDEKGANVVLPVWCTVEHDGEVVTVTFSDEEGGTLLPSQVAFPMAGELIAPRPPGEGGEL